MQRWQNKVAVVTGASSGIGAATAVELVKLGLQVVGVARREERVQALQSKVSGAKGRLFSKKADVAKQEDIRELFDWVKKTFGTIHVLINNAGVIRYGRISDQDPKYWRQVLDVNVMGLSICTQEALKLMKESGVDDGHIFYINSILGHQVPTMTTPLISMYAASKHAVTALTETLRQELRYMKSNIKISSISPGIVDTDLGYAAGSAVEESERFDPYSWVGGAPGRTPILQSKDIADAIVYVLSTPPHVQIHELIMKPMGETV